MYLNIKTEFSFRSVYGKVNDIISKTSKCSKFAGIADANTFGFVKWEKACIEKNVNPIFSVSIPVVVNLQREERRYSYNIMTFVALKNKGIKELFDLVRLAHDQFYYMPRVTYKQISKLPKTVLILSGIAPKLNLIHRKFYIELSPQTNSNLANIKEIPAIACCSNAFINKHDRPIYEPLVDDIKRDTRTTPQHILTYSEWLKLHPKREDALENLLKIGNEIKTILPKAPMVKFKKKFDLVLLCVEGAKRKGIDLTNKKYISRLEKELKIIKQKGYADYFMVVIDIINYAKQFMLVGHGRGSAAGSLVCFLCGITNIDPIKYNLFFERFIDINRLDLPDIDIDFQEDKRFLVINYIREKYGLSNVAQIGNVSTLQSRSALVRFAKAFDIPESSIESIKTVSDGQSLKNTFEKTDTGKEFIERFPIMENAKHVENHAIHASVHASGILICNKPVTNYCGMNTRDNKQIAMIDKNDAEHLNLLKVDVLGLRTLSIIDEVRRLLGKNLNWMDVIPLNDKKTFKLLNKKKLTGIFQLEGEAVKRVTNKMKFNDINDIIAIGALCRPGPMSSGGANSYVKRTSGLSKPKYHDNHIGVRNPTKDTFGVIVYQEQVMQIAKQYCNMSWEKIGKLRKAISKSKQKELEAFKKEFIKGALKNGAKKKRANDVWNAIEGFGSYAFNKCLSGNTKIKIANGNQYINGDITIAELYQRYESNPTKSVKEQGKKPVLISFDGVKGIPQKSVKIIKNGIKNCNRYHFNDGSFVECTKDHGFIIDGEWQPIKKSIIGSVFSSLEKRGYELKGRNRNNKKYPVPNEGFMNGKNNPSYKNGKTKKLNRFKAKNKNKPCEKCGLFHKRMEAHHKDFCGGDKSPKKLTWLCPSCHKKEHYKNGRNKRFSKGYKQTFKTLVNVEKIGMIDTYDIEMPVYHNFMLSNGLITHNSHAVSYGILSYITAFIKINYPEEFTVASLNHSKSPRDARKLLREMVKDYNIKYVFFDKNLSLAKWSIQGGILYGGVESIDGIAEKKAITVINNRKNEKPNTPGLQRLINNPTTPFKYLYPARDLYLDENHEFEGIQVFNIVDLIDGDRCYIIGELVDKQLRDMNEPKLVNKRNGRYLEPPTSFLTITIEDDTKQIKANVWANMFEDFGKEIAENGSIDKDWYLISGTYQEEWQSMSIETIEKITKG